MKKSLPIETLMFAFGSVALGLLEYELTNMNSPFIFCALAFVVAARVYVSNYLGRVSRDDSWGAETLSFHSGTLSILFIAYAGVIIVIQNGFGLDREQWIQLLLMILCIYSLYICQRIFMLRQEILGKYRGKIEERLREIGEIVGASDDYIIFLEGQIVSLEESLRKAGEEIKSLEKAQGYAGEPLFPPKKPLPHIGEVQRKGSRYLAITEEGIIISVSAKGQVLPKEPSEPTGVKVKQKVKQ